MTFAAILFLWAASSALLILPRNRAALPLLATVCYMTLGQGIEIGAFNFPVIRLVVLVGFIRVVLRSELPPEGTIGMDCLVLIWAAWALISSAFHNNPAATLVNHMGMVYNTLGVYFLIRCFCRSIDDAYFLVKITGIVLLPVALAMLSEKLTQHNFFADFGGLPEIPQIRGERVRAQGPFAHPILAGTVGATCFPLMIGIWRKYPTVAKMGAVACLAIMIASASSGPIMSVAIAVFALALWPWRHLTKKIRVVAVVGYCLLEILMKAPGYYLIARVDLTGSSTGWHRAKLIQSAVEHFNEWWFAGTDYTRHWMNYGVPWSEDHVDITNHYLAQGVRGGLPLMVLFIMLLWCGFRYVGQVMRLEKEASLQDQFLIWALGASLLSHAATCISVAYFDQSILFLNMSLAMAASIFAVTRARHEAIDLPQDCPPDSADLSP